MAEKTVKEEMNSISEGEETDVERHRRERRELQATIQQMKKSVNKNDKTRKKKLDADIRALEEAFEKKWANFNENAPSESIPTKPIPVDVESTATTESTEKQHVSRKARRQANKDKREAEAHANEEPIDYENHPDTIRRRQESSSIDTQLAQRGLEIHSIAADGNCLFASIVDQSSDLTVRQLREIVADYLREHRKEFEPFIESDYEIYCEKLAKDNVWGGQIELQACAQILQRSIEIIQGNGKDTIIIECRSPKDRPIIITYHRYLYSNGEHYNSTRQRTEKNTLHDDDHDQ